MGGGWLGWVGADDFVVEEGGVVGGRVGGGGTVIGGAAREGDMGGRDAGEE